MVKEVREVDLFLVWRWKERKESEEAEQKIDR